MNLFIVTWNLSNNLYPIIKNELCQLSKDYPVLKKSSVWSYEAQRTAFAASVRPCEEITVPRNYLFCKQDEVVFYDGCIVDSDGSFKAHDARELSLHWKQISQKCEGNFVVIRITAHPPSIELINDFAGLKQIYYYQSGKSWVVSNSVRLISRIFKFSTLDPLGSSLFLNVGWVGSDRTLSKDIKVIPSGQYWKWEFNSSEPKQTSYSTIPLYLQPQKKLTQLDTEQLLVRLIKICHNLEQSFGDLTCALTGGFDTRLLLAILFLGKIPAKYFTYGTLCGERTKNIAARIIIIIS